MVLDITKCSESLKMGIDKKLLSDIHPKLKLCKKQFG
jgi:hypothetical protein